VTRRQRRDIVFFPDESALSFGDALLERGYSVLSYSSVGLEINKGVSDDVVARHVRKAGGAIIITKNPRDFKGLAGQHLSKVARGQCDLGCGIVQVPHEAADFNPARIERKLYLPNGDGVDWDDVMFFNWLVVIHRDGKVEIRELGQCEHCRQRHADCGYCQKIVGAINTA
jgi:hypothetical protein